MRKREREGGRVHVVEEVGAAESAAEVPWEDGVGGGGVDAAPAALEHRRRGASPVAVPREQLHEQQPHHRIDRSRGERGGGGRNQWRVASFFFFFFPEEWRISWLLPYSLLDRGSREVVFIYRQVLSFYYCLYVYIRNSSVRRYKIF